MPDQHEGKTTPQEGQKSALRRLFNLEFLLSVILPIIVFLAFDKAGMTLAGTITAGAWSLLVTIFVFIKDKRLSVYAVFGMIFSLISLAVTIVSRNPVYYLASPIVSDLLYALAFLVSVVIRKPLIQVFAEYQMKDMFSPELRAEPMYKAAWMLLTGAWGLLSILKAAARIVLLLTVSTSVYFSTSTLIGNITSVIMLIASVQFPSWYWNRAYSKKSGQEAKV